ncbi:hypothetical protein [Amorphus orientalis]|uniref:hypothetical protein n=1 Tax=Amorphus orientalis TaxID=649198 RepID=UPI0027D890F6|nr:hypothetical protein [Amorphus orientalis]
MVGPFFSADFEFASVAPEVPDADAEPLVPVGEAGFVCAPEVAWEVDFDEEDDAAVEAVFVGDADVDVDAELPVADVPDGLSPVASDRGKTIGLSISIDAALKWSAPPEQAAAAAARQVAINARRSVRQPNLDLRQRRAVFAKLPLYTPAADTQPTKSCPVMLINLMFAAGAQVFVS